MQTSTQEPDLRASSGPFLDFLESWQQNLPPTSLPAFVASAGGPEHVGIFCVDVINGFCHEGPLHSDRVKGIIAPIHRLFTAAYAAGIRHFVLPQDTHSPHAAEFAAYPPHCIRGTSESRTVPELADLSFASSFTIIEKNAVHAAVGTSLNAWLDARPEISHFIVVGDCTDICTYHLALHLKFRANAADRPDTVLVPTDCVDTYDTPLAVAQQLGIPAHPAPLFHALFLYSMAQNGIRIVQTLG
ncbi:MAG: Amidase related to nicotinamidase [Chthonomonadaceae bacterium]|nr:Amidase related to nicotinamidase [Chthonomonadaceae bacterium]